MFRITPLLNSLNADSLSPYVFPIRVRQPRSVLFMLPFNRPNVLFSYAFLLVISIVLT